MNTAADRPPYYLGFTSLEHEVVIDALPVEGAFPPWLNGALLRTAPAKFEVGSRSYNHWFDGLAMLHKFALAQGRVSYANRFLRGGSYCDAERQGRIARGEFATDPCRTLFQRVASLFTRRTQTDNANVNVAALGGEVVALTEPSLPVRFDPGTLETLGVLDYGKPLSDAQLSIAHPHYDAERRRHYSYVIEFGRKSRYRLFSIDEAGRQQVIATMPVDQPAYMHSIGMSERHLVLAEFPLRVSPLRLKFSGEPFIRNYRWQPDRGLVFHVFDRDGRRVASTRGEAAFAFHHVNAYDENDAVVVDLVAYPDARIIDQLYLERLRGGGPIDATGFLTRYRVPLDGSAVPEPVRLSDAPLELPRINYPARAGRRYAYVYGAGNTVAGDFIDNLVKIDVETGRSVTWREPGCYPGEPVFVATPDASAEDEGVVLSVVLDVRAGASFLLALDAVDFSELARARVPHHVPFGFHGSFFPRSGISAV